MNNVFAATVLGALWLTTAAFAGQATDSAIDRAVQLLATARVNHDQHTVASFDHQGMVIIFTWWKNKHALNDFYYSDAHQGWMSRRGQAITGARAVSADDVPSQVAIEVFIAAPGGTRLNGGFAPAEIGR